MSALSAKRAGAAPIRALSGLDVRLIGYGALVYLFSGVGQSYFFQFIRPDVIDSFGLNEAQFGQYYFLGTLASGFVIMFSGRIFDWFDLRTVTVVVLCGAVLSCWFFASAWAAWLLVPAIFLQRQFGQGLMSHVPAAAMSRYFTNLRGRATSVCNASYSLGEATLPQLATLLLAGLLLLQNQFGVLTNLAGWRAVYIVLGAIVLLVVLPLSLWLLRGHDQRQQVYLADQQASDEADKSALPGSRRRQWTLREVLRDPSIWMLAPTLYAPSFIFTGLVIYGLNFADELGVSHLQWTALWSIYAIFGFCLTFPMGWVVDRFTATRLAPFTALPMALALFLVQPFDGAVIACVMLLLWSVCQIFTSIVSGPLFAELYGVKHLGSIKAAYSSVMVVASAGGPLLVGTLLSQGVTLKQIGFGFALYIVAAALVAIFAVSRITVKPLTK